MSPQVSVVLPTHNRAHLLQRAVASVLQQTLSDLELIVVDDGSTDETALVLSGIIDQRLVTVRLDERRGAAAARNAGIRKARAPLVAFQDSDDEWLSDKLERQVDLLRRSAPAVRAVGGRYRIVAPSMSGHVTTPYLESGANYEREVLDGACSITPLWLIERALLEELQLFDEDMPSLEDWDLLLRLTSQARVQAVAADVLVKHGAPDSLGGDLRIRPVAMEALLQRHAERFRAFPTRYASFCLEMAYLWFVQGHRRRALRYAGYAISCRGVNPAMLGAFARAVVSFHRHGTATWPVPGLTDSH